MRKISDAERIMNFFMTAAEMDCEVMAEKIRLIMRVRFASNVPKPLRKKATPKPKGEEAKA